jgi:hypothetical protein
MEFEIVAAGKRITTFETNGTLSRFGHTIGGGPILRYESTVEDVRNDGEYQPFSVTRRSYSGGVLDMNNGVPWWTPTTTGDYVCSWNHGHNALPHLITGAPSNSEVATRTMAASNPSRSVVDLPIAALELKELPQLIMSSWKGLLSKKESLAEAVRRKRMTKLEKAAELNLLYQFGWKPLLEDIVAILDLQRHIDKRVAELEKLRTKGLRKSVGKHSESYSATSSRVEMFESFFLDHYGVLDINTRERVWGIARWVVHPEHPIPSRTEPLRDLARRAVLGLTLDASTIWNAIPYSWLVDWTSTIGSYFDAHRNIVPAVCDKLAVCRHITSTYTHSGSVNGWGGVLKPIEAIHESKMRFPSFPSLSAHLPFLNEGQASILGSIAILRQK